MDDSPVPDQAPAPEVLESLALELQQLREHVVASEAELAADFEKVHPENLPSARNLAHYLALRRHDIRSLQMRLAQLGLSSLGRSEPHVLVTLDRILAMLALARGTTPPETPPPPVGFQHGERILAENARRLLGPPRAHRNVRVIVTMPTEAGSDPQIAANLLDAGMDCARINCARDDATVWAGMADNVRAAERVHGRECKILVDLGGRKLRTGAIPGRAKLLELGVGDRFELLVQGSPSPKRRTSLPGITCSTPGIFQDVQTGQPIWFDNGRIGGIIEDRTADRLRIRVTHAKSGGSKLRPERGINLPETELTLPALGAKDRADLAQVAAWADVIELSFAQREEDVSALHDELRRHHAEAVGIILKIETRLGFAELPRLLLAAMRCRSCGVMIARGDLAVEAGFERMAEMQEEILWIAEAAHLPTVWATQVLENLARERTLSRAEVTDAAMSGRAEAVMLNKGPYIVDAIRTLDDILGRMQEHQSKKRPLFRALRVSASLWD
ncbi:MAG: pyruvate kinase [Gemmatimonadota bacterium]